MLIMTWTLSGLPWLDEPENLYRVHRLYLVLVLFLVAEHAGKPNSARRLAIEYLIGRLVQVNFRNDASIALDIANHLEMLRESWIEVDALSAKNNDSDDVDSAKVALQPANRKLAASQAA